MAKGGKREGAGRPRKGEVIVMPAEGLDPQVMSEYATGLEFMKDVVNLQFAKLGVKAISMAERIKCATEMLAYTDQQKPKMVDAKVQHSWADRARRAEIHRVMKTKTPEEVAAETAAEVIPDVTE